MKSVLKRAGWLFLALLFVGTGLGVGVWAFLESIRQKDDATTQPIISDLQSTDQKKGSKLSGFTPLSNIGSLTISDLQPGTGAEVKADSRVTVDYIGAVASTGVIFESSVDQGQAITTTLDRVIAGWQGLIGAKVGGVRRLLIPAEQAYGPSSPSPDIPPNSDLVFDVTILEVK